MPAVPSDANHFWLSALLWATLYSAAPLILAAMGGVLSERSGVVNIALEGMIIAGAFTGAWIGASNGAAGLAAALAVGLLLGFLHAMLTQTTKMDHVVSGLAINLFAAGATRFLAIRYFPVQGIRLTGISPSFFLLAALILPIIIHLVLKYSKFGLRLRASGEYPESARMAGVSVLRSRYIAVTLSGICAAAAGAYLSLGDARTFTSNMSAGKGYIALAAVIFGKWHPLGAMLGALFFGFFYALQTQLQISAVHLVWMGIEWNSPAILDSLPYLMTIAALISVVGRAVPPASLGAEEGL